MPAPVSVEENGQSQKQPKSTTTTATVEENAPSSVPPPPVSFFRLFRFATKSEILFNSIGVLCAIAAGAAQVRIPSVLHHAHTFTNSLSSL
jgi:ATP-binding cassette, subfamily B (MDR/TAP), member 1